MKNIKIQLFIIFIGILLSYAGFFGIKKYFYNEYKKKSTYNIVLNNYSNVSFMASIIENEESNLDEDNNEEIKEETTSTAKIIEEVNETSAPIIEIDDSGEIIYDGLTMTELTNKLNRNLNSTLSNTGYYFADYYRKTGLDPYLAVAIVLHETGCKWTCSSLVTECNNIGGMKGGETKCGTSSYRAYSSLEEGINGYLDMLYNNYYKEGLTTAELINPKYAASTTWSTNINNYIEQIRAS